MAVPARLERAWCSLERFAGSRAAAPALVGVALAVYGVVSVGLPLGSGRDLGRYLIVYAQLFDGHVLYPYGLVTRTPGTPLVTGVLLDLGPVAAEVGAAVLYALSILAWFTVARRFGPAAAIVTAVALLVYPGYVLLFHTLSSDAVFAAGFAGFAVLVARALEQPSLGRTAALGAGVAGLVLIRPVSQILLLLVLVPLFVQRQQWRRRLTNGAAFVAAAVLPLAAWAVHNELRADDFTVVRGGGASIPFFRAFVADRIVQPENGPATRELARTVARDLLPNEPYRSYKIDLERFFSSGSARMHEDLIGLSDRTWGWDDDYGHLGRVGREAVLAHPGTYVRGVADDLRKLLVWPLYVAVSDPGESAGRARIREVAQATRKEPLPVPSEGEPIPSAYQSAYISTPDGRIRQVWTSPVDHHVVFRDPADQARAAALDAEVGALLANFPDRAQRPQLVRAMNHASRWYPRPVVWLLVGLVAIALRRPLRGAVPIVLSGAALLLLVGTALTVYGVAEYSIPVTPAFVLLAAAGLFGRRPMA